MILKNCNAEEFIKRLNGRKVICFGAGTTLVEAEHDKNKITNLEKYIAFFVDNDKNKHGLKFNYCGLEFDIKSIEIFDKINISEYVLLITCAFYIEIYEQLKEILVIKNLECYMYDCICNYSTVDIYTFFTKELEKKAYKEYKNILKNLNLKDKYKGQRCFVIGNGPSLRKEDLERLKSEITFGVNGVYQVFFETSWRPTYYVCIDYYGYALDHEKINGIEAEKKFIPIERALAAGKIYDEVIYYNRMVNYVDIKQDKILRSKEFKFSENVEEVVFGGQTVLYDVLQFVVYMGFSEIYLLGVDCNYKQEILEDGTVIKNNVEKDHFSKDYDERIENIVSVVPPIYAFKLAFQKVKEICDQKGIIIKNATRGGKLEVFERIEFEKLF